jgi:hypothetical protein
MQRDGASLQHGNFERVCFGCRTICVLDAMAMQEGVQFDLKAKV